MFYFLSRTESQTALKCAFHYHSFYYCRGALWSGAEILNVSILNSYQDSLVPSDASIPVDDAIFDTLGIVAVQYKNSSGKLRLFEYGDEDLALLPSVDGGRGIVSVNGSYVTRTLYDEAFRRTERISWKQGAGLPFIANRKTYIYKDPLPKKKFLKKHIYLQMK